MPGGAAARRLARAALAEAGAREALVTLAYVPGCTGPVDTRICLDGRERPLGSLPRTAGLPMGNAECAASFREVPRPLVELARWGHFQPGMPWERIPVAVEERV